MKLLRSFSFRLAIFHAVLLCASVAMLGALFYVIAIRTPFEELRQRLVQESEMLTRLHERASLDTLAGELDARARETLPDRKPFHALIDPDGLVLTANLPSWPSETDQEWLRIEADVAREGDEVEHEALVRNIVFDDGTRLLVGRDVEDLDDFEETIGATFIWILPAGLILSLIGGALMSRAIGQRIDGMASAARAVIEGDLSRRVEVRGTGDDFDSLGETLNLMLDRIESSMDSVRRVSDSVAHELRTPLMRLQASLADLRMSAPSSEAVSDAIQEADRLEDIFNAVLRISRIEAARSLPSQERVDLTAILSDASELYQPVGEERGLKLDTSIEQGLAVEGDRDLIFQATANLLDNALKFSPDGGVVAVEARAAGDRVVVTIEDSGPGIPVDQRERVTERFFRGRAADGLPGAGLGLSLVAAVGSMHDAPISFGQDERGLRVVWTFRRFGN